MVAIKGSVHIIKRVTGNVSKYKASPMQNNKEMANLCLNIQSNEIESTNKLNILGVIIDCKCSFSNHVKLLVKDNALEKGK